MSTAAAKQGTTEVGKTIQKTSGTLYSITEDSLKHQISDRNSGRLSAKTDQKYKSPTRKFSDLEKMTDQYLSELK